MTDERVEAPDPLHILAAHLPGVVFSYRAYHDGSREALYLGPGLPDLVGRGVAREVGESLERLLGRIHPDDVQGYELALAAARAQGGVFDCIVRVRGDEGYRWIHSVARPVALPDGSTVWHGMMLDVDARRRADDELRRLESSLRDGQRLESLGALAGGIAHEFNNLLQTVLGNVGIALGNVGPQSPLHEALAGARDASLRAADLCRQLLDYTGQAPPVMREVELNELVREMARLFQVSVPRDAVLALDLAPERLIVQADPAQLRQVILNLVTNAAEALADAAPRRVLTLRTAARTLAERAGGFLPEALRPGAWVLLEVEDTGRGMDEEARARAFDPFFSTKEPGRGMGLAATLGILRAHGGGIRIDPRAVRGTRARVMLPAVPVVAKPPRPAPQRRGSRSTRRVLVVDDEPAVRSVCERILKGAGFEVTTAAAGEQALESAACGNLAVDVAVLDLTMPRLDGHETLEGLRRILPGLPAVLISGYDSSRLGGRPLDEATRFLPKPFLPDELIATVREALEARAEHGAL